MAKKTPAKKKPAARKRSNGLRRCLVEASILSIKYEYSLSLGPGTIVDLDDHVGPNLKLRDFVREEWFEAAREVNDGSTNRP